MRLKRGIPEILAIFSPDEFPWTAKYNNRAVVIRIDEI
jgi:hypothetical protein